MSVFRGEKKLQSQTVSSGGHLNILQAKQKICLQESKVNAALFLSAHASPLGHLLNIFKRGIHLKRHIMSPFKKSEW